MDCTKNILINPLKPVEKEVNEIPMKTNVEISITNQKGMKSAI